MPRDESLSLLGYYDNGSSWVPIGTETATAGTNYSMAIRDTTGSGAWTFRVDGVTKATFYPAVNESIVDMSTGLESNCDVCTIGRHSYKNLQYKAEWNFAYVSWTGRDNETVTGGGLCGEWVNDYRWKAARGVPCS